MKLFRAILTLPLLLGLLYACNDDDKKVISDPKENENNTSVDETTDNKNNTNTTTNDTERTSVKVADVNYAFTEFDLEVEYADHKSYDVEYENDGDNIYAELEDDRNFIEHEKNY